MALSYVEITSNGNASQTLSFSFDYLSQSDISVYVDGVLKSRPADWDFTTSQTIVFVSHPASGAVIRIERNTPATARNVDFQDGSVLSEADLDNSANQIFFIAQEASDTANSSVTTDPDGKWNAQNRVIKNVADPVNDQDAVNKRFISTNLPNITTVAGIASDVTTVAGIQADVTAVAADATDIGVVSSNINSVNTVATNIADVITVANDLNEAISEIETAADDLNEAVSEIDTVSTNIANVNSVGTNIANVNTVAGINADVTAVANNNANVTTVATNNANVTTVAGISGNVTTVAGISGNVTTVAGIDADVTTVAGISSDVTTVAADQADIGIVATNIADVSAVAANNSNITSVAGNASNINAVSANSTNINAVNANSANINAVAGNATNINAVNANSANINTVAGDSTAINTVATDTAAINTVASNLTNVNNFADTYAIGATAPVSPTPTIGDLWFDTSSNSMKVYGSSGWQAAGSSVNGTAQRVSYTATGGQTSFAATYDAGYVDVYLNGVKLIDGTDFTATSGTSVVLASGAAAGDTVDIVGYGTFQLSNFSINDANDVNAAGATTGQFLKYDGANWVGDTVSTDLVADTTPQLGGNLDLNSSSITGTGNINITGSVTSDDLTVEGTDGIIGRFKTTSGANNTVINVTSSDAASTAGFSVGGNASFPAMTFENGGSERMRITSGGSVGIGNASPTNKLHVESAGANYIVSRDSTSGGTAGVILQNGSDTRGIRISGSSIQLHDHSANLTRLSVDASGHVTMPYQPFFSAYKNGNQALSAHTPTKLTSWSPIYNVGSGWNASNNRWTAPAAGYYVIHVCAQSNVLGGLHVRVDVNGSTGWCGDAWLDGGDVTGMTNTYYANLATNDYVEFWAYLTASGNINANRTRFSITKVA